MYRNDNLKKLIKISIGIMHNKTIFKSVRFTCCWNFRLFLSVIVSTFKCIS